MRPRVSIPALLLSLAAITPITPAQPDDRPPPPQSEREREGGSIDRTRLEERLKRMIAFAERIIEKNRAALERLEQGEDPERVVRSLRTPDLRRADRAAARDPQGEDATPAQRRQRRETPVFSTPDPEDARAMERVRAFIAEHLPEVETQLARIEALGPNAVRPILSRLAPPIIEIMRLEREDSALAALKLDELRAGLAYVEAVRLYRGALRTGAPEDERAAARRRVESAASARFDVLVRIKLHEIDTLSTRVERLRASLDQLVEQREEQIDAQVDAASRTPGSRFNRPATPGDAPDGHDEPAGG